MQQKLGVSEELTFTAECFDGGYSVFRQAFTTEIYRKNHAKLVENSYSKFANFLSVKYFSL